MRELGFDLWDADYRLVTEAILVTGSITPGCKTHTEWEVEIDVEVELEMLKKRRRTLRYVVGF